MKILILLTVACAASVSYMSYVAKDAFGFVTWGMVAFLSFLTLFDPGRDHYDGPDAA